MQTDAPLSPGDIPEVDAIAELTEEMKLIARKSKEGVLALPQRIYEKSSAKAFFKLTKSLLLLTFAYVLLTQLPWYLLPIGWLFAGTTLAGLLAVGYACRKDSFFTNSFVNHLVGQLCLIPLIMPFESWHATYRRKKESFKHTMVDYLSRSHFWWCSSFWQSVTSNVEGVWSLVQRKSRKRLVGNLVLLYLFCALFFPLMTYNLGLWGLAKYYIIPLMIYHFWASSFLKTSSLLELLDMEKSDVVCLAYYKYPKWVEFLSLELNYAFSSLQRLAYESGKIVPERTAEKEGLEISSNNHDDAGLQPQQQSPPAPETDEDDDLYAPIPFYNLKEAIRYVKESHFTSSLKTIKEIKFQELSFFSLLKSRTGDLIADGLATRDVIAEQLSKISWVTTLYLTITPIVAAYGLLTCEHYWQTWVLFFFHYLTGGLGITAGYHRLFSHRAYKTHPIARFLLLFFGTGAFQMSVLEWCNDHRAHHRYTDTDKDPYSITKGFWYAHMGWLLWKRDPPNSDMRDLEADPMIRFQHKHYPWLAVSQGLVLPMVIAGCFWGDWWGGLLIAGVFSRVVISQATFCVNSLAHYWGEHTFSDQRTPRDSVLVGLLTLGEGYHNFHHEFPYDYRNGVHLHDYDPTKWLIKALSYVGLTYDLLEFPVETIAKGKLQMQEKRLAEARARLHWGPPEETLPTYSMARVKEFVAQGEQLIVVDGFVHDVRGFLDEHPAGKGIMKPFIGKDASKAFNGDVYNHSNAARNTLQMLRIARLEQKEHQQ